MRLPHRCRFNPRPLLLTGESLRGADALSDELQFQSTPVIANGRIAASISVPSTLWMFQSTPVIANGRILRWMASATCASSSFNPRPLLLTGESSSTSMPTRTHSSFNPRPLLLTGESPPFRGSIVISQFQSTPVIANGRIDCIFRGIA